MKSINKHETVMVISVCVRESKRARERDRERESEGERFVMVAETAVVVVG